MFCLPGNKEELKQQLAQSGVISIPGILQLDVANGIRKEMEQLPWQTAFVEHGKAVKKDMRTLSAVERQQLFQHILASARTEQYQFCYDTYMLITNYLQNTNPQSLLHFFVEQICHPEVLQFVRDLTGRQDIIKADGQASRYLPGHFLKRHNDDGTPSQQQRIVAYTISFSQNWQADWGGLLHLQDKDLRVTQSLTPEFNTMNIFTVPRDHFVSQVASYCPEPRLSIVGWFRTDRN
ncbi:2OG-Fe(II) oxygenase [Rheinheimera sp.]|uniref:2OG-Fe(II) oxygenase n=1 Tax=Rheinheimera sp. TaxID=1869214 RepID=UPI003AF7DB8B